MGDGSRWPRQGEPAANGRREVTVEGDERLAGILELPASSAPIGGVVVAHPHPLHGGTMHQPVVHHVARACRRRGLASLRFDFRGVGGSSGRYSGTDEYRDIRAAADLLREELGDGLPVFLAGYSFGAVMSALAVIDGDPAPALGLIAFPVDWDEFMPGFFGRLGEYPGSVFSLCGENDSIALPAQVEAFLRSVGVEATMVVVPGVDHLFVGKGEEVGAPVARFFAEEAGHAAG